MPETRKIIRIDEDLCTGCGECVTACEEGALEVIDGKARVIKESFCDGLGACIGECPEGALTIEERPADAFDEEAVKRHLAERDRAGSPARTPAMPMCPAAALRTFEPAGQAAPVDADLPSMLGHWPIQLRLVPPDAPFLKGADLIVCADCVPFAVPDFHARYLTGRSVVIGCPKLDDIEYYQDKLKEMFAQARPARVTVLRMEVPCCGAMARAVLEAGREAFPDMPVDVHTIGIRGGITCQGAAGPGAELKGVTP